MAFSAFFDMLSQRSAPFSGGFDPLSPVARAFSDGFEPSSPVARAFSDGFAPSTNEAAAQNHTNVKEARTAIDRTYKKIAARVNSHAGEDATAAVKEFVTKMNLIVKRFNTLMKQQHSHHNHNHGGGSGGTGGGDVIHPVGGEEEDGE
ncbi:hypothetical protein R80B4_00678 [Fibrobacteres bacterium R8-0-B4]